MQARNLPPQIPPESVAASSTPRPAQSPPEIAPVLAATDAALGFPFVNEDLSKEDMVDLDASNLGAWQEVVPRRLARSNRLSPRLRR